MSFSRVVLSAVGFGLGLVACGGGGDGGGDEAPIDATLADTAVAADMAVADMGVEADASVADQAADFCRRAAAAKCEWAIGCVDDGPRATVLGLPGDTVEACAETAAAGCIADSADRASRGTLAWDPRDVEDCVEGLGRAPCQMTNPTDWLGQWLDYVYGRCGSVLRGSVTEGDPCESARDCADRGSVCAEGACRPSEPADLMQDCDAESNTEARFNDDPACVGGICVQVGANDQDKAGMCSINCLEGSHVCPDGTACIRTSINGAPSYFCTAPCERDAQCRNGFVCDPVDPDQPLGAKHCWAAKRDE